MKELISNGTDIIDINRIQRALERHPDAFLNRTFTEREQESIRKDGTRAQSVAVLFSVKESIMKSLGRGIGQIDFREIEILKDEFGKPEAVLSGKAEERMKELGICEFLISISHEKHYALTFVVAKK